MRILYHHRTQGQGGEGVHIREVVLALRQKGHVVDVLSPPGVNPMKEEAPGQKPRSLFRRTLSWLSSNLPQFCFELMEIAYNFYGIIRVKRALATHPYDVLYERYAFFNFSGGVALGARSIPFLLEVNEVSGIERTRGQAMVSLASWMERKIFSRADSLLVVSRFIKEQLETRGVSGSRIEVIANAIRNDNFDPSISSLPLRQKYGLEEKICVGFIGHFAPWDQLDVLIRDVADLRLKYPSLHLLLVGSGNMLDSLQSLIRELDLETTVTLTGKVSRDEVAGTIQMMDICVLRHSNPFGSPIVLFEYMAMAKPVLAPRLGPVTDILQDGENGLVFDSENSNEFCERLEILLSQPETRQRLGNAARQTIISRHTWEKNAERIDNIAEGLREQ